MICFFLGGSRVGRRGVGRGWVAAGSRLGGSRQAAATHLDGNGNGNGNGNDNGNDNGNGNELSGARYAPNQRAQGSHTPFGAPLIADHPHSDEAKQTCLLITNVT